MGNNANSENMKKIILYTDGSCSGNPGPGGWAAILKYKGHKKEISGGSDLTTNNRMEMTAAIEGIKMLKYPCDVEIYTDSAYLFNGFDKGWIWGWQKKDWKTSNKKPVKNQDLWEELLKQNSIHNIKWIKVKGHSDNPMNNRCDELATEVTKKRK